MRTALSAFLVDSNILVYAYDPRDHAKQQTALEVLDFLIPRNLAVFSVQCLTEFFRTVRWRLLDPISHSDAFAEVENRILDSRILNLTPTIVLEGCRGSADHNIAFWDALIWAAAKLNEVPYILTEDGEHGQSVEGVTYLNPFNPDFELSSLEAST